MLVSDTEQEYRSKELFNKQFVFVMGCPRSGTTWIHKMLSEHPDIAALPSLKELTTFTHYLAPFEYWWNLEKERNAGGKSEQGLPLVWNESEYDDFVFSYLYRVYRKIELANPNTTHILDKHPGYIFNIDLIKKYFPKAKLIHIVRDGRDVVLSMYSANKKIGFASQLVDVNIKLWRDSLNSAENLKKYPNDYIEFKYEDLQNNMKSIFTEVCKLCNLNTEDEIIDPIIERNLFGKNMVSWPNEQITDKQRKAGNVWRSKMSTREKFYINKFAGYLLKKYGYINHNNWWFENISEKLFFYFKWGIKAIYNRIFYGIKFIVRGKI